jgi:endo-1,4-beta-xylanase
MLVLLLASTVSLESQTEKQPETPGGPAAKIQHARDQKPSWLMPPIQGPNLHYKTFESKAAGEKVSYLLYLPPDYETATERRYPVVYWLHGIGGSQQGVPRLAAQFTMAIRQGKMPSSIVVFANGMIDSFYCDDTKAARPVETVIIRELIPHVDATFRTIAARQGRMIEGFSMGGFGAGHIGFKYPEAFGSVSIIDGALLDLKVIKRRHAELFQRLFDGQDETFTAEHPGTLIEKNAASIKGRTRIRQAVGALVGPNAALHEKMTNLGIEHSYDLFAGVGHNLNAIYERLGDRNWEFYRQAFTPVSPPPGETGPCPTAASEKTKHP